MNDGKRHRVQLCWVNTEKIFGVIAYDCENQSVLYPIMDYAFYLAERLCLSRKTVRNETWFIKSYLEFMLIERCELLDSSDALLLKFRDCELEKVRLKRNCSGSDKAAKRTVNAKLRRVYHFLVWLQDVELCGRFLVGPNGCKVESHLTELSSKSRSRFRISDHNRFPLVYRGVGERSKHRTTYVATDSDVDNLVKGFLNAHPDELAQRNILILEFANRVGMRRGSINSLRAAQFSRSRIEDADGDFPVTPDAQKFGYENKFYIPFRLAFRVCDYIEQVRNPYMKRRGWTERSVAGLLFFSATTGNPLVDSTISKIFGNALSSLRPDERGANIHSLRRKYANDEIQSETQRRFALGLDTSASSIAASVAIKMGQSNPASLEPYVSKVLAKKNSVRTVTEKLHDLEQENQQLKIELAKFQVRSKVRPLG